MKALSAALVLLLAGCTGLSIDEENEKNLREHFLILHPPVYEWNEEKRELTGHFILTNRFTDQDNPHHRIKTANLHMRVNLYGDDRSAYIYGATSIYDSFQEVFIEPTQSMVFNFTFPEPNRFADDSIKGQVNMIDSYIDYTYYYLDEANIRTKGDSINPDGRTGNRVFNENRCLQVVDGELHQRRDASGCSPFDTDSARDPKSQFRMGISHADYPPADVWPEWTDDSPIPLSRYPELQDDVEFLRGFDFDSANIVYFEGRIR